MIAAEIKTGLQNLGIKENDIIIIHSSYKNLCGKSGIDPSAVIKAFKETVKSGTLMLPALSYESIAAG